MTRARDKPTMRSLHDAADRRGEDFYIDAETGYQVFTEHGLRCRGDCCGSGCRHCPYAHRRTPLHRRVDLAQVPAWLTEPPDVHPERVDLLVWDGRDADGLARLRATQTDRAVVLLTLFDAVSRRLLDRATLLRDLVAHAQGLSVAVVGVPLHPGDDRRERLCAALRLVPDVDARQLDESIDFHPTDSG